MRIDAEPRPYSMFATDNGGSGIEILDMSVGTVAAVL